ncbi:hypothetical protein P43SY_002062 [Pythium insidiosum]|uniref:Striatin N-terminal domain-containing protein n=1 Tax=Pythium insidiosum TaxID=114742 RepID=A0AAD5LGH2_PYTIN|nr:hypothetical protein P43SY_002062 [Pythium insidiosum]
MDSVDSALRFLQRSFASVANEEAQWREEKQKLEAQVRELENQRSLQEEAYKDALLRVKMLEFALRQERGRYLVSPAPVIMSVSRTVERVASAQQMESPMGSPKPQAQIYRIDSSVPVKNPTTPKGMEITRPRMGSRGNAPTSHETTIQRTAIAFHPTEPIVVSGSEDCTARVWNLASMQGGPPSQSALAQFDFHGEQLIQMVRPSEGESLARELQVNSVISHPTMPIAISAHQDRKIRMFDMRSGHDGSLRIWSVAERQCVFEQQAHRPKWSEAIHSVAYHPSRNFVATSGADGLIKVFQ